MQTYSVSIGRNEASPIIILNKGRRFLRQRDKLRRKCHSENILRKNEQAIYLNATYFVFVMPTCSVSIGRNEASPLFILKKGRRFLRQRDKLRRKCHSENILRKNEQAIYLNATYSMFVMPRNEASPIIILNKGRRFLRQRDKLRRKCHSENILRKNE